MSATPTTPTVVLDRPTIKALMSIVCKERTRHALHTMQITDTEVSASDGKVGMMVAPIPPQDAPDATNGFAPMLLGRKEAATTLKLMGSAKKMAPPTVALSLSDEHNPIGPTKIAAEVRNSSGVLPVQLPQVTGAFPKLRSVIDDTRARGEGKNTVRVDPRKLGELLLAAAEVLESRVLGRQISVVTLSVYDNPEIPVFIDGPEFCPLVGLSMPCSAR